jgi:hypothetical protein
MTDEELLKAFSIVYAANGSPPPKKIYHSPSPSRLTSDTRDYAKSKCVKKNRGRTRISPRGGLLVRGGGVSVYRDAVFVVDAPVSVKFIDNRPHGKDAVVWKDGSTTSMFHGEILHGGSMPYQWRWPREAQEECTRSGGLRWPVVSNVMYPSGISASVRKGPALGTYLTALTMSVAGEWTVDLIPPFILHITKDGRIAHQIGFAVCGDLTTMPRWVMTPVSDIVQLAENSEKRLIGLLMDSDRKKRIFRPFGKFVRVTNEHGKALCLYARDCVLVDSPADGKYFYESSTWWDKTEIHLKEGHYILLEIEK